MSAGKFITRHVGSVKAFLAGTFMTAAALGALSSLALPTLSALSLPFVAALRVSSIIELGAPLFAGLIAALLSERRKLSLD